MGRKKALPPNHLGRKAYGFRGTTQLRGTEPRTRFPDNGGRPVRAFPRGSSRANTAAPDRPACSRRPVLSWAGFLRRTSRSKHFNTPFISYSAGTCKRKLQKNAKRADPPGPPETVRKAGSPPPSERKIVTKETHQGCLSFSITAFSELFMKVLKMLSQLVKKDF